MVGLLLAGAGLLAHLGGVGAASISSCGGPHDVFQPSELSLSPDPIKRGAEFTITAIGKLSKAFSGGATIVDLDVNAQVLSLKVDKNVQKTSMMSLEPAVPEGDVKFILGPLKLPPLPGKFGVNGRVSIVDEGFQAVACLEVHLQAPLASDVAELGELAATQDPPECPKPGDHLSHVSHTVEDGWDVTTLTFDEAITETTTAVDLKLFLGRLPLSIKMTIPALLEPGIPKGDVKVRSKEVNRSCAAHQACSQLHGDCCPNSAGAILDCCRTSTDGFEAPFQPRIPDGVVDPPLHLVGDIVVVDGQGEEITCVKIDVNPGDTAREQTLVV